MRILILVTILLILLTPLVADSNASSLPSWVKNLAYFYSKGEITDQDFITAIQYLETVNGSALNLGGYTNATEMVMSYSNSTEIISNYTSGTFSSMPTYIVTLSTDKSTYKLGSFIEISGNVSPKTESVSITLVGPDSKTLSSITANEDSSGNYFASIESDSFDWSMGTYTITASSSGASQTAIITID